LIDQLKTAIDSTVRQFQDNPTHFLSERDIQALLFVELRNATIDLRNEYVAGGANSRFGFADAFRIHPVTTEYYLGNGNKDRFDIAILSKEPDPNSAIWRQPCSMAFEIKLWQPGYKECGYYRDVQKLQRYQEYLQKEFGQQFMGIAMLFVHPNVKKSLVAISEENSGNAYPANGVALHLVNKDRHCWKQQILVPSIPEQVGSFAQTP
jgi:hypothetical protein